jgi:hypothetical protein
LFSLSVDTIESFPGFLNVYKTSVSQLLAVKKSITLGDPQFMRALIMITIKIMIIMATMENVLLIPGVPLMILGYILVTIIWLIAVLAVLRRLGLMKVSAGLVIPLVPLNFTSKEVF